VSATIADAAAAVKQAFRLSIDGIISGAMWIGRICVRFLTACSKIAKACGRRGMAMYIAARDWGARPILLSADYIRRRKFRIITASALLAGISGLSWYYWPAVPKLMHRVLPKAPSDTPNADFYYLVNILFVPLQTFLLLIGGAYAWRTLRQSHKFKQHDVEARCITDYLALEQRLAEAGRDNEEIESAVRAYWTLMLYEYYWWRHDLLSRDLFTNWCEFRAQRFHKNAEYRFTPLPPGSTQTLPFTDYRDGYAYFKGQKVYPGPSRFDDLMQSLIDRATAGATTVRWSDIEQYRRGKDF